MSNRNTKMIRITSRGRVRTSRGVVTTPIQRPYREDVATIFKMLSTQPKPTILEVLENGKTVELTPLNFDKDNNIIKPEIKPASIIPSVNNADMTSPSVPEDDNCNDGEPVNGDGSSKTLDMNLSMLSGLKGENVHPIHTPTIDNDISRSEDDAPDTDSVPEDDNCNDGEPVNGEEPNKQQQGNKKKKNKRNNQNNNQQKQQPTTNLEVVPEQVQ